MLLRYIFNEVSNKIMSVQLYRLNGFQMIFIPFFFYVISSDSDFITQVCPLSMSRPLFSAFEVAFLKGSR